MSDTTGQPARRALPPRDDEAEPLEGTDEPRPRRVADDDPVPSPAPASRRASESRRAPSRRAAASRTPMQLGVIAGIVAAVALIAVVALFLVSGGGLPTSAPSPTSTPTLDRATLLAEPAELSGLRSDTTWQVSTTATAVTADTPQPRCLATAAETRPTAKQSWVRTFTATGGTAAAALHQIDHYASVDDAARAWEQRVAQVGTCAGATVWLRSAETVAGVSDQAVGVIVTSQEAQTEHHTIVVSRSGTDVNIIDLTSAGDAFGIDDTGAALAQLGTRQCAATSQTCPTQAAVEPLTPPITDPPGWLAPVDLPRLTPGAGSWRGTDRVPVNLSGAACEAIDLAAVPGATIAQRTYLLYDDNRAQGIGIDEALYTFATEAEATDMVTRVMTNVDACPERTTTATVQRTAEIATSTGKGFAWAVTQKTSGQASVRFRIGVVATGTRVVYVFANPSDAVDFSDDDWQAIVVRAVERSTQLP